MLYDAYEFQRSMLAGASAMANFSAGLLNNPANPFAYFGGGPVLASALDVFAHAAAPRGKPAFGLTETLVDGRTVAVGDFVGQARVCVENVRVALAASDAELTDVVFVRVLVASTSRDDLAVVWEVVHEAFGAHEPPGTLQGVTVLGWQDQLVEVEVIAAVADE